MNASDIAEFVREDPELAPTEKETYLRFAKDQDYASVYTPEAGISRRLLAHPETDLEGVTVVEGTARPEVQPAKLNGRDVVAVRARVPVATLKIQGNARSTDQHAPIVAKRVLDRETTHG